MVPGVGLFFGGWFLGSVVTGSWQCSPGAPGAHVISIFFPWPPLGLAPLGPPGGAMGPQGPRALPGSSRGGPWAPKGPPLVLQGPMGPQGPTYRIPMDPPLGLHGTPWGPQNINKDLMFFSKSPLMLNKNGKVKTSNFHLENTP